MEIHRFQKDSSDICPSVITFGHCHIAQEVEEKHSKFRIATFLLKIMIIFILILLHLDNTEQ